MDENAWAGATANVYVLKYVLEKKLGCTVNIAKLPESTPLFQAMADGKVDVVPEDWNNIDLKVNQKYLKSGTIMRLGSNGVIGHIGWFIPTYLMKEHPEFKTWQGLKGKESIFKSPESGNQGMFLGGDPSYVQKDQQLIKVLGLNLKFVSVGASRRRSPAGRRRTSRRSRSCSTGTPRSTSTLPTSSPRSSCRHAARTVSTRTTRGSAATGTSTGAHTG